MMIDNWDEIRTAYQVAKLGTVSGAAQALGVHHATVIRHIDSLEQRLGVKLFQRHARGYTSTEAGIDLLKVAQTTDDQFSQLVSRIKGRGEDISGELVVTSLPSLSIFLTPILADFQAQHPNLVVRYLTGDRLFRLEYGEAHIAVRAGRPPQELDNVAQPFKSLKLGLYAHKSYLKRIGNPSPEEAFDKVDFVGHDDVNNRAPFLVWLAENVARERVAFRVTSDRAMEEAVLYGAAAGFVTVLEASKHADLVEIMPPREEWAGRTWLVTHVDLHRTPKVQAFLSYVKERAKNWGWDD